MLSFSFLLPRLPVAWQTYFFRESTPKAAATQTDRKVGLENEQWWRERISLMDSLAACPHASRSVSERWDLLCMHASIIPANPGSNALSVIDLSIRGKNIILGLWSNPSSCSSLGAIGQYPRRNSAVHFLQVPRNMYYKHWQQMFVSKRTSKDLISNHSCFIRNQVITIDLFTHKPWQCSGQTQNCQKCFGYVMFYYDCELWFGDCIHKGTLKILM